MQQYLGFTAGAVYGQFEHKADSLIAKFKEAGGMVRETTRNITAIISALVIYRLPVKRAVNHYRDNAITHKAQRDKNARERSWRTRQLLTCRCGQRDVAVLDAKYTKELADAKAENDALRDDAAAGRRRLHIKAVCQCVKLPVASGVDNAASDWQTPPNGIISPSERG